MSVDAKVRVRCDGCNRYCRPADSRTTFGCSSYDPPEPCDPDYFCKRCAKDRYVDLKRRYSCCYRSGDWQKSDAEVRAAKEAGLVWIHSNGLTDTYNGRHINYEYVRAVELEVKASTPGTCLIWITKQKDEKRIAAGAGAKKLLTINVRPVRDQRCSAFASTTRAYSKTGDSSYSQVERCSRERRNVGISNCARLP
jgi:hypothetical protein